MKRLFGSLAALMLALSMSGCGLIYTHTIKPLDFNLSGSPCVLQYQEGDIKHFEFDIARVLWDSNAIGDIILLSGMDTVYFADIERLSILGIWNQHTVHVYGR